MGGPSTWPTHPASQPNGRSQNQARDTRPATFMGGTGSSPGRLQGSGPLWGGALLYLRLPQAPSAPSQAASGFQAEGKAL